MLPHIKKLDDALGDFLVPCGLRAVIFFSTGITTPKDLLTGRDP
jgi:hypothetical protein